jgi:hypothetical protein
MFAIQLGESANELVTKWGRSGYRYGFPDFYAAEFPVRPMAYDQSRIYSGVIGRHYPEAKTGRYHYMFDQNMYQQPGVPVGPGLVPTTGLGETADEARKATARKVIFGGLLGLTALAIASVFAVRAVNRSVDRDVWDE